MKNIFLVFLFAVLFSAGNIAAARDLNEVYMEAITMYQSGEYQKAITLWEEILAADPEQAPPKKMIELARKKIAEKIAPLKEEIRKTAKEGDYAGARQKYIELLSLDPSETSLRSVIERLDRFVNEFGDTAGSGRAAKYLKKAADLYIFDNNIEAVSDLLTYTAQISGDKYTRDGVASLMNYLRQQYPEKAGRVKPLEGFTLVEQFLQESLNAIYEADYVTAIDKCSRVLVIEEDNVTALMRLGSAYYALNRTELAEKYWKKVLVADPGNQDVKQFLDVIKEVKKQ